MGIDFKSALAKGALEGHRACAAGQGRDGPGESGPEPLAGSLRGGQVDEHESARGPEDASHLSEGRLGLIGGQDINDVTAEDGVERIVGMGERRYVGVAEAVPGMGTVSHPLVSPAEHRVGEVYALRPAGGGGRRQRVQGQPCAGPRIQNVLAVPYPQPRPSQGSGPAGHEGYERVVQGRKPPVGALQGSGRSRSGEEHE